MGREMWLRAPSYESASCIYHPHAHSSKHRHRGGNRKVTLKLSTNGVHATADETTSSSWQKMGHKKSSHCLQTTADLTIYALVVAICICCYANSLNGDFVHDDLVAVTSNPDVLGKNSIKELLVNDFWGKPMREPTSHKSYRPLTVLTFRLNYFFSGLCPWSYHLVNVLLHSGVSVLIAYLCFDLLRWHRQDSLIASLLFATHPIHTEAVSNIVGRAEMLSAFLFLASLICFMKSTLKLRSNWGCFWWLLSSLLLAAFAVLAKEQGIAVLPVCIAWRLLQLTLETRYTEPKFLIKKGFYFLSDAIFWLTLITFVMLVAFRLSMLQGTMPKFSDEDNPASFSSSVLTRFYTYSYLAAFNTWLLLNPTILSYDWQMGSVPLVTTTFDIRNGATVALCLFLVFLTWRLMHGAFTSPTPSKKFDVSAILVALSLLALPFLPASNIFITVGFVVAERVLYIPSIGFCVLVSYGLIKLRNGTGRLSRMWKTLSVGLIVLFFTRTVIRNEDWASREALFRSGLRSVPHNAKVHYNFANLQKDLGNVDMAVEHYKVALKLWPRHASAHNNLGTLLLTSEDAERHFRSALIINPQHPRALFNLASLYSKQGRLRVAQELLQRVLELDPDFTEAYCSLANLYTKGGRIHDAEILHLRAINTDLNNADSFNNYGIFLQKTGRVEEAVLQYKEAIRLQPNHTVAIVNAARSLRALRNNLEAERLYKRALAITPEAKILDNLGVLYISAGRMAEASKLYREMQDHHGDYVEGKVHYAQVLMQERSFQKAEQLLTSVVQNVTHRAAFHQLSLLYSQINKTTEALEYILKALNLCPTTDVTCAQLHVDHGDILKDMKHWDDAAQSYKMAIELEPRSSHAHVNLAVINHLQGECHKALRHYHEAYILDPNNQLLLENMRKLKLHLVDDSGTCNSDQQASCKSR